MEIPISAPPVCHGGAVRPTPGRPSDRLAHGLVSEPGIARVQRGGRCLPVCLQPTETRQGRAPKHVRQRTLPVGKPIQERTGGPVTRRLGVTAERRLETVEELPPLNFTRFPSLPQLP